MNQGRPVLSTHDHSQNIVPRDRTIAAAIDRVGPIIAQDEVAIRTALKKLSIGMGEWEGRSSARKVMLLEFTAVDINGAKLQENEIPCFCDNSLHRQTVRVGIANDDDLFRSWSAEMVHPTVKQVMIRIQESRGHAPAIDGDGLQNEVAENEKTHPGQPDSAGALAQLLEKRGFSMGGFGRRVGGPGLAQRRF
jgi:hypothetical protein